MDANIRLLIDLKNLDENLIAIVIDINNNKVKWQSSFQPTMLDNIYQFELNVFSNDEVNYKKSKTDLYFYGIIK